MQTETGIVIERRGLKTWFLELPGVDLTRRLLKVRLAGFAIAVILASVLMATLAGLVAPYEPNKVDPRNSLAPPSAQNWLGTDRLGRDQLTRVLYGARISLAVAVTSVVISVGLGMVMGIVGGYLGGIIDDVFMRIVDAVAAFPSLVLSLALVAVMGIGLQSVIIAIGVTHIPFMARVVRSQVLRERERDYVLAARAIGARDGRIMLRHVTPNSLQPVIVQTSITMGYAVIIEASLSFLGVGIRPPTPSWGGMLKFAFNTMDIAPWLAFAPGIAIFLLVLAFNLLGDALRDVLDPRLRGAI